MAPAPIEGSSAEAALAFILRASASSSEDEIRGVVALLAHADEEVRDAATTRLEDLGSEEDEGGASKKVAAALAGMLSAGHKEEEVREQAVGLLAGMGEAGAVHIDVVTSLLVDAVPSVRAAAAEAVAQLRAETCADQVAKLLADGEGAVRATSAKALAQLGPLRDPHTAAIAGLLADTDAEVRCSATAALAQAAEAGGQYVEQVARGLSDNDWRVRAASARAIGSMGPAGAAHLASLADRLADSKTEVARSAARALAQLGEVGVARKSDLNDEIKVQTRWSGLLDSQANPTIEFAFPGEHQVWLVRGLLSRQECAALLAAAEGHGFGGTDYPKDYRGNLRLIATDPGLTRVMWTRLEQLVPRTFSDSRGQEWQSCGLNECWRLSKYHPGDRFQTHCDTCFQRTYDETSMLTVNIYLNDGFAGGSTRFYLGETRSKAAVAVEPEAGMCLLFRQPPEKCYRHDGEELKSGLKYLLRSDVMYRRK